MDIGSALIETAREAKRRKGLTHRQTASSWSCHEVTSRNRLRGAKPMTLQVFGSHLSACGWTLKTLGRALASAAKGN